MKSNSSGLHNHIIINGLGPADHRLHLVDRPPQGDRKLFVIGVKASIAQGRKHGFRLFLISSFVINFLVKHHRLLSSVLFQITISLAEEGSATKVPKWQVSTDYTDLV